MSAHLHYAPNARRGFTLVEVMVTIVIIAILSSLSLAGLNGARQRSKISKTQSTLRKLNEVVTSQYDAFLRRRLAIAGSPATRLAALRAVQALEMPDSWGDIASSASAVDSHPPYARTSLIRAYAAFKNACSTRTDQWGSEECLYLMISRSGDDPGQIDQFRTDEVFDYDKDGAPEFKDGWNTPIRFLRWAPGYSQGISFIPAWTSPIQINDPIHNHDPLDWQRTDPTAFALYPLLISAGPDEQMEVVSPGPVGTGLLPSFAAPLSTITSGSIGAFQDATAVRDNLTNHTLLRR